jgi:hypothetical protein
MSNDLINGLFELFGSFFILNHCRLLYKAKVVHGVSVISTVYFAAWGFWNLFFYPSLNQWFSTAGGIAIMLTNSLWIGLMMYYNTKNKSKV